MRTMHTRSLAAKAANDGYAWTLAAMRKKEKQWKNKNG